MAHISSPWARPIGALFRELGTDSSGLSRAEAAKRLAREGGNEVQKGTKKPLVAVVLAQLKNPLALILLVAAALVLVIGNQLDALVIFIALAVNVAAGAFQEERAGLAFERLSQSAPQSAIVVREGKKSLIAARGLVQGDIVLLEAGSAVPADIRLFATNDLSLNESALTGEWEEVPKEAGEVGQDTTLSEQRNMARAGTLVVSGHGRGVVVATGKNTELGLITSHLSRGNEGATPIEQGIRGLSRFLLSLIGIFLLLIFFLGIYRGEPLFDMILLAIAIGVAAVPAGLPAAVTVVLALGMEGLSRKGGLVRNLHAAETLGSTTVILTDKTGTLTEAKMKLSRIILPESSRKSANAGAERGLLRFAVLSAHAFLEEPPEDGSLVARGRPIERAIVLAGLERELSQETLEEEHVMLDFLPFDSARRFGAALRHLKERKRNRLYISGAPETLLARAEKILRDGRASRMSEKERRALTKMMNAAATEGARLIALCYKDTHEMRIPKDMAHPLFESLTYVGLLGFEDPLRANARESVRAARAAGARVLMVTGDNPHTAHFVARRSGIARDDEVAVTGDSLEPLGDAELLHLLRTRHVFARMTPLLKLRIAGLLRDSGEVVAMTGDGINDAPALRRATIGVSVGSGTEVAKEASDLVLLRDDFAIIPRAIEEGRRIMDNIKKIVAYLLSTNFSEIILIGAALMAGAPLPLLPTQILWANMVGEGLLSFSFAAETKEEGILARDPKSAEFRRIVTRPLRRLILTVALVTGGLASFLYFALLGLAVPLPEIRTIMFVALSFDSVFFVLSFKNLRKPLWKSAPFGNIYLSISMILSALLLLLVVTLPPLRTLLSLAPLSAVDVALLAAFGAVNVLLIEGSKTLFFRARRNRTRGGAPLLRESAIS